MKLVLVGDLHGNLPATEAIAREIARIGADDIWYLGDAVGKGPSNAETCAELAIGRKQVDAQGNAQTATMNGTKDR